MSEAIDHIRGLVELTGKEQRDRVAFFVDRPKRWVDLAHILNGHESWHFDRRYWIDCKDWSVAEVCSRLIADGALAHATIVFAGGRNGPQTPELPLREAVERYHGTDIGVVVSCIPGRLVYFEGHEHDQRGILKR